MLEKSREMLEKYNFAVFFSLCAQIFRRAVKKNRRRKILIFFLDTAGSINCVPVDLYENPSTLEHSTMPSDPLHSRPKYEGLVYILQRIPSHVDPPDTMILVPRDPS